jgi:hypothetical protein
MNKTLYIKDEEAPLWERARQLSNDRLSPVIVEALRRFVAGREAELKGVQRIVIEYDDDASGGKPTAKAFQGRWLIAPEDNYKPTNSSRCYSVADTPKGGVVIRRATPAGRGRLFVYSSFDEALSAFPTHGFDPWGLDVLHEAIRRRGVPVEELDV